MESTQINTKEIVIHNIIASMGSILEAVQLQALENAIRQNLQGLLLEKECTQLSTWRDDNSHVIKVFLASKKLEGCKEGTLVQYKTTARLFFEATQKNYRDVTKDDIKIFLARRMMQQLKETTIQNNHRNLSTFFSWLHSEGYIARNPVGKGGIKVSEIENIHLTPEEEVLVRDIPKTIKEAAVIDFLLSTGVRVGELAAMNRTDIDWGNSTVTFQGEKGTRKYRTVILDARAKRHLRDYLQTRNDCNPALFVTDRRYNGAPKRMSDTGLENLTKGVGERAGLDKVLTVHVFRRTLATRLYDAGAPLDLIQELLGHRKAETTQRYIASSRGRLIRDASKYFSKAG